MPVKKVETELEDKVMMVKEEVKEEPKKVEVPKKQVSVVESLVAELKQNPEGAVDLVKVLYKITKPWEAIGPDGSLASVNEVPVPPGKSAQAFQKLNYNGPSIGAFKLTTIFGDEVALIVKDSPKWKITIEGEPQVDGPFVEHGQKAEAKVKAFVEERLTLRGFIISK